MTTALYSCFCEALRAHLEMRRSMSIPNSKHWFMTSFQFRKAMPARSVRIVHTHTHTHTLRNLSLASDHFLLLHKSRERDGGSGGGGGVGGGFCNKSSRRLMSTTNKNRRWPVLSLRFELTCHRLVTHPTKSNAFVTSQTVG